MDVGLKQSDGHCPVEGLWKLKLQVEHYLGQVGHCPLGGLWKHEFLPKTVPFFPNLILEL
jgi:hypothetical protein